MKQTNLWNQGTLREYVKECPKSLKYLGKTFISHEKMEALNLPPPLSLLGVVVQGFSFQNLQYVFYLNVALNSSTKKMSFPSFRSQPHCSLIFFWHLQFLVWLTIISISTICTYIATCYHYSATYSMTCHYYALWTVDIFQETIMYICAYQFLIPRHYMSVLPFIFLNTCLH